jgi:hypothetical protein
MFTSMYIKQNAYLFNQNLNDYIKKTNEKSIKQLIENNKKYNDEQNLKQIMFGTTPNIPLSNPTSQNFLLTGLFFISLPTLLYYFYSKRN